MGPQPEPSVSGSGWERTSKGAKCSFPRQRETKHSGLCEDEVRRPTRKRSRPAAPVNRESGGGGVETRALAPEVDFTAFGTPTGAQRQRVRLGEDEQGSEVQFSASAGNET